FLPVIPTLRTASRPDAGSRTRPFRRTTSNVGAAACAARSAEHSHATSRIAITLLFLRRRGGLGGGLLFPARAAENVAQTGVAFVARVFADGIRHVILLASLRGDYGADLHRTHRDRRGGSATCPGERPRVEEPQQVVDTGELMDIFLTPAYAELRQAMAK